MSNAPDDLDLSSDEQFARAAVRSLPRAAEGPSAEFRAGLRERFFAGSIESTVAELPEVEAPVAGDARGQVLAGPWLLRPSVWVPLAAAAALAFALGLANRGPAWEVSTATGVGVIRIDGQEVPAQASAVISRLVARGGRVQLPEEVSIDLVAPGFMVVRLAAGSDVRLSGSPNRWIARNSEISIESGDVFVATGREFPGSRLVVSTDEARVDVLGTSFAVMRFGHGTCVCVMEGSVRVGSVHDRSSAEVVKGQRRFCYADQPAYTEVILESSEHELHQLIETSGAKLDR